MWQEAAKEARVKQVEISAIMIQSSTGSRDGGSEACMMDTVVQVNIVNYNPATAENLQCTNPRNCKGV